ncbi:ATP-binding protein [Vibrio hippocampi]|uniref:histidine kinase n=1 Tax=Vibrio hippocampi TaxID=654686 RepID=A0ABN8DF82_9VIBR|nr:ATP-binding protein [Vibrio hippocampi]CAH0525807.1 Adaptive-response sensory-kinase SasA [Vibrio hippocampi]
MTHLHKYAILCMESDLVNLDILDTELSLYQPLFDVHLVTSVTEAQDLVESLGRKQHQLALVIARQHSQLNGEQFLIHLEQSHHAQSARKILLSNTSSDDIHAIVNAINQGRLDHCLRLPLSDKELHATVTKELTHYVIHHEKQHLLSYGRILDQQKILRAHIENKMHSYRASFIHDFHELTDEQLATQVIEALQEFFAAGDESRAIRSYSPNHLLTSEGGANQFLWFIVEGEVALYKTDELGQKREVIRHGKGGIVGGMSFVTGECSFSTAKTLTKTDVIKLDRNVFTKVMHSNTDLLPLFTNLLLRHFNRRLQRSINTKLELQKTIDSLESAHNHLIEQEKMAMLGQLIAGVAHELNNPVSAILRGAERLSAAIDTIFQSLPHSSQFQLGLDIMQQSQQSQPLSTSELRQRTKVLQAQLEDRRLAKRLVNLNLQDHSEMLTQAHTNPTVCGEQLHQLEQFQITGSTLRSVQVCAQRIADMVKSLKGYSRPDNESFERVDLHEGIEDTLVIFENRLKHYQLIKEYSSLPFTLSKPHSLQQVWTNLVSNALDAMPHGGQLTLRSYAKTVAEIDYNVYEFSDTGSGIAPEQLDQIFELNFTTKKQGNFGLGIGLSVCQQIVTQHQGWIEVESIPNQFTKMSVYIPIDPTTMD